jgi:chemotaxis protein methyltransferase CheR
VTVPAAPRELDGELAQALRRACGFSLQESLERLLARRLGPGRAEELRERIRQGDPEAVVELIESAVVCETYFFRNPEQLAALSRAAFRPAASPGPLSIWSAGCATGEEAYSVAAVLLEAGRAHGVDRILATDVSRRALDVARAGRYGSWSLRRPFASGAGRWLRQRDGGVEVAPELRSSIEFRVHNLLQPAPKGPFDVVLCRNVLIYFDPEVGRDVLARLAASLRPGGWLVVAPAELGLAAGLPLESHLDGGAVLLRRTASAAADGVRNAAVPPPPRGPARLVAAAPAARPAPLLARPDPPRAEPLHVASDPADEVELLRHALAAQARGNLTAAIDALRRALYLDPDLAMAHACLVLVYRRAGRSADAERARRNALRVLEGLEEGDLLRAAEPITAGALRSALELPMGRARSTRREGTAPRGNPARSRLE